MKRWGDVFRTAQKWDWHRLITALFLCQFLQTTSACFVYFNHSYKTSRSISNIVILIIQLYNHKMSYSSMTYYFVTSVSFFQACQKSKKMSVLISFFCLFFLPEKLLKMYLVNYSMKLSTSKCYTLKIYTFNKK